MRDPTLMSEVGCGPSHDVGVARRLTARTDVPNTRGEQSGLQRKSCKHSKCIYRHTTTATAHSKQCPPPEWEPACSFSPVAVSSSLLSYYPSPNAQLPEASSRLRVQAVQRASSGVAPDAWLHTSGLKMSCNCEVKRLDNRSLPALSCKPTHAPTPAASEHLA